ncbi:MAG TPA: hypothetical protein VNK04_17480 [Gemmataceae bacterium]|nr:hypothetical protein [Gemmataceae bacterium]
MARSTSSPLERQVAHVGRRLFMQVFLDRLFGCWTGALVLSAVWFLVQPFVVPAPSDWLRWAVAGGAVGAATVLALLWAVLRRPSPVLAALALDEKFALRERVTTSLTLPPHQANTPAALALLEDVNQRVAALDVGSRFPIRLPRNAALLPLGAALLALVALFYEPVRGKPAPPAPPETADKLPGAEELEKKIAQARLERKAREKAAEENPDDELKKFEEDLDRIFGKPRDTKEQLAKRVDEMEALKRKMEDHQKDLAERSKEKAEALKQQLQQAERLAKKQGSKDGPAKDLEKAINQGDLKKAQEEVDRLAKKLKDNELTKEEQQKLSEQLQELKERLEQLTQQEELEEQLRELARRGDIDEETLNRELEKLRKNSEKLRDNLQDLQDIAEQLAECQKCLRDGNCEGAAKALARAGNKMSRLGNSDDLERLSRQLDELREIRRSMSEVMGESQPIPAAGRRPEEEDQTGSQQTRISGESLEGRHEIVGTAPGSNFRRPRKPEELTQEIKQASQEAPEALERQRIPRAASDIAKGYFENLGGQKEPPRKGAKP